MRRSCWCFGSAPSVMRVVIGSSCSVAVVVVCPVVLCGHDQFPHSSDC
jgi:hypothetical protein